MTALDAAFVYAFCVSPSCQYVDSCTTVAKRQKLRLHTHGQGVCPKLGLPNFHFRSVASIVTDSMTSPFALMRASQIPLPICKRVLKISARFPEKNGPMIFGNWRGASPTTEPERPRDFCRDFATGPLKRNKCPHKFGPHRTQQGKNVNHLGMRNGSVLVYL